MVITECFLQTVLMRGDMRALDLKRGSTTQLTSHVNSAKLLGVSEPQCPL